MAAATPLPHPRRLAVLAAAGVPAALRETAAIWNARALLSTPVSFPATEEPHAARWRELLANYHGNATALLAAAYPVLADHPPTGPIEILLQPTPAGPIPILTVSGRADFTSLLQQLGYAGRHVEIPTSVGAMYLSGVPLHPPDLPRDRLILLTRGGYAGLSGQQTGMAEDAWLRLSLNLRRTHEITHYLLHRLRGRLAKNLTEEIIADAEGLRAAIGHCPADLLGLLLGVTASATSTTNRYLNYLPSGLSGAAPAFRYLLSAACQELADPSWDLLADEVRLAHLAALSLEDLAANHLP